MRSLLAAISFLSRLPVPARLAFDGTGMGRAAVWFPVVGAMLGGLQALVGTALSLRLPATLTAVLVVALGVLVTGALHVDGLADMADGFGGGGTREDVLRIMRDHAIGTYGAVAVVLLLGAKVAALSALVAAGGMVAPMLVAAASARWSAVALAYVLPYARREGGLGSVITQQVGTAAMLGATACAITIAIAAGGFRGAVAAGAAALLTVGNGAYCRHRIGGVTGDTLGANVELCEALVLIVMLALR